MMKRIFIILLLFICFTPLQAKEESKLLFDITDKGKLNKYVLENCEAEITGKGDKALKVNFVEKKSWPYVKFFPDKLDYISDWSEYSFLAVTISHPEDKPVKVLIRIDSGSTKKYIRAGNATLAPGEKKRMVLSLEKKGKKKNIVGMLGQPPRFNAGSKDDISLKIKNPKIDVNNIRSFQISMPKQDEARTLLVHKVELLKPQKGSSKLNAFVDKYGQYKQGDWPGKLKDEKEFQNHLKEELADLEKHPGMPDRNKYGGWEKGPKLEATGHFRVQKYKEKWWIVDPDGRLFWSSGITCVDFEQQTPIQDERKHIFSWLPETDDPLAKFYGHRFGKKTYNFYTANIYRKYGEEYEKQS